MNPSIKSKLKLSFFFLIAILLLYVAFREADLDVIVEGFKKANYLWVFLALLIGFASLVVRALRWRLLIEPLGSNPSLVNTTSALAIGYMANLIFPRLGEVTRCGTLRKTDKIPFESLFGTVIVERAFDLIMMVLLVVIVFFVRVDFFGKFLWSNAILPIWAKIISNLANSLLFFVGALILIIVLIVLIRQNIFGSKFHSKVSAIFWGLIDGVKSVFTMKRRKAFFSYTLLLWFLYWLMTYFVIFATEPTSSLGPIDGFFLLVVGSFGMAAPVQGGIGAFHIITAMALGIYGISWEDGLVYAVISHGSQTLFFIVIGLISLAYLYFRKSKIQLKPQP